jgi:hypothetical protein
VQSSACGQIGKKKSPVLGVVIIPGEVYGRVVVFGVLGYVIVVPGTVWQ